MLPAYRAFLAGNKMRTEFTRPNPVTFLERKKVSAWMQIQHLGTDAAGVTDVVAVHGRRR